FGYTPAERAQLGNQRIREALAKDGPGTVKVVSSGEVLSVNVDGHRVFRIPVGDLDADDGQTLDQARIVVTGRLDEAIAAYRQSGQGRTLIRGLIGGVVATVVLVLLVWIARRIQLLIRRRIDAQLARRLHLGLEERAGILRTIRAFGQVIFTIVIAVLL